MVRVIQKLILILIALTPFISIVEVLSYLRIDNGLEILYIKLIRDILIVGIFFLSTLNLLLKKIPAHIFFALYIICSFTLVCILMSTEDIQITLAGIRWLIPVFLIYTLHNIIDDIFIKKISKLLAYLIAIHIVIQIIQMFYMPALGGLNLLGLSGRLPGIFVKPATAGIFSAFCLFFFKYFPPYKKKTNIQLMFVCICSVLLSMSSAGVVLTVFILVFPLFLRSKHKLLLSFVIFPIFITTILNLDTITGRNDGSSLTSISTRFNILEGVFDMSEAISTRFGSATNAALNIKLYSGEIDTIDFDPTSKVFIADAMYISVLTNYGYILFGIFIIYIIACFCNIFLSKNVGYISASIVILLTMGTIITSEIFPINIFSAILFSYYMNSQKRKNI